MILPILNPWPNTCLTSQNNISNFAISVGSTICHSGPYLFNNSAKSQTHNDSGSPDLAPILCSTTATSRTKGFTAEHLSRVWRIDIPTAKRTIENTTQLCQRTENPTLSRNYSTNDCMLRYHQHFSMDTSLLQQRLRNRLEATPACSSLSATDSGFVHAIPLRSRSDVPHAVKAFAKTIGAPNAIICDASQEQMSREVRSLCHKMHGYHPSHPQERYSVGQLCQTLHWSPEGVSPQGSQNIQLSSRLLGLLR